MKLGKALQQFFDDGITYPEHKCLSDSIVKDFAYNTLLIRTNPRISYEELERSITFFNNSTLSSKLTISRIRNSSKETSTPLIPLVDSLGLGKEARKGLHAAETRRMHSNGMRASRRHARTGPFTCNRSRRSATYARILLADQLHV